ncbi:MAG: glycosyltransferase family 4 protein [Desulfovibrio sp.]|nr:glycosyltransferase family 4 protein [Desulfovibrio sp.]
MGKGIFGTLHPFLEGGAVYGRKVANTAFMQALLTADPFDTYHFFVHDPASLRALLEKRQDLPAVTRGATVVMSRQELPAALRHTDYHCFHLSDPVSGQVAMAALRNALAPTLFPVTSINHSLSYTEYALRLLPHIWAGTGPCDAIGATSRAAARVLAGYFAQLREGYALPETWGQPQLEIIPLGVDTERFTPPSPAVRVRARTALGVAAEDVVCLLHGRISVDDKMDALPLLFALHRVMQVQPEASPVLVISGAVRSGDAYPQTLWAAAQALGLRLQLMPDPDEAQVQELLAAADIFLSLSDNIQESFGLTVLEAGAAGLPAIVSDWDGYRDLVQDGTTGFLVPTLAPAATPLLDVEAACLPDNVQQLWRAQQTVVDVPALARQLQVLLMHIGVRKRMGQAAWQHVLAHFSWPVVIDRWIACWERLRQTVLTAEQEASLRSARHPLSLDLARLFGWHASALLDSEGRVAARPCVVRTSQRGMRVRAGQEFSVCWPGLENVMQGTDWRQILVLARRPISVTALLERLCSSDHSCESAIFTVLWALKQDLLECALLSD